MWPPCWGLAIGPAAPATAHEYRFENGIAGTAATAPGSIADSGAPAADGTPQGGPLFDGDVPLDFVSCSSNALSLRFDGADDTVSFGSPFIFHAPFGDATFEFFMKAPDQSHRALVWARGDVTDVDRFHMFISPGGVMAMIPPPSDNSNSTFLPPVVIMTGRHATGYIVP